MKAITIEKDYSIKLSSEIVSFLYPDYVFIPMSDGFKLQVGNKAQVKKEQVLLSNDNGVDIYSPISGIVVGVKNCLQANGVSGKCLVIENDFKEKLQERATMRKSLNLVTKTEFFRILETKKILDCNNKLLLNKFNAKTFNRIIVNSVEDEPYLATNVFLMQKYANEVLETLSFLGNIFKTKDNMVILKDTDRDNVEQMTNILGTYPEICLTVVPDIYPIGNKLLLANYVNYDINDSLVLNVEDLVICYNAIKKNKRVTEKLITITGNAIANPIMINAKIGSLVKNIIDENIKFINNEPVLYAVNGLLTGNVLNIDDLIVTSELNGIIINFQEEKKQSKCINCGKCLDVCPVGIDPNLIFNKDKYPELKNKCINCGLCTYICPAYINFKKKIEEYKHEG